MTSSCSSLATLPDRELLAQLESDVQHERQATARIIALLMEVDARKLYAQQSCSSLFTYCVQMLHLSEHAAYLRIEAARAARRFPTILERLADGSLTLTTIGLVAPHLTVANHLGVLDAARHKSKRDVEQLVACLRPLPDVAPAVRKLPTPKPTLSSQIGLPPADVQGADAVPLSTSIGMSTSRPIEIKPLAPERFKVQFTINRETHDKLRQVQDLLRHTVRDGDLAAIFDRALTALLVELSKAKLALTDRPRSKCPARSATTGARISNRPPYGGVADPSRSTTEDPGPHPARRTAARTTARRTRCPYLRSRGDSKAPGEENGGALQAETPP